jgi:Photosynthesis system II assembly factor YCF48
MKIAALALALSAPLLFAEKWKVQYFYDQDRAEFVIEDLAFPSARRGVAVGTIFDQISGKKIQYTALVTSDGGEHWSLEPVKEHPRSIFFLNDSIGWMVTDNSIWFTEESGRGWKKISDQKKPDKKLGPIATGGLILRVWFLDAQHGYAIGYQKTMLETRDGGRTWTPVEEAAKPTANAAYTAYTRICFNDKFGVVVGGSTPPRRDDARLPSWMDPEEAVKRRQIPTLTILVQTNTAGEKWTATTAPLFGIVTSVRLSKPAGLLVFGFNESFDWPSEVYRLDTIGGKNTRVFREKNRRVIDSAVFPGPRAFLGAIEPPGKLNSLPIPGKVKMLTTTDFSVWTEMDVDYKAVARSLVLAGPDAEHLWAATDTGMILRLTK